jgi:ABC-type polysaccharide/polyol phosphate export permease
METLANHPWVSAAVRANPLTPYTLAYQEVLYYGRVPSLGHWLLMLGLGLIGWGLGTWLFDRLRDTLVEAV